MRFDSKSFIASRTLLFGVWACTLLSLAGAEAKPEARSNPRDRHNVKEMPKKSLPRMIPIAMPSAKPAAPQKPLIPIAFEKLESGKRSGITLFDTIMVNKKTNWDRLMTRHRVHGVENTSPLIDFEKETVLGVFAGSKPTDGYSVEILNVYRTALGAKVVYKIVSPAAEMKTEKIAATTKAVAGDKGKNGERPTVVDKAAGSKNADAARNAAAATQPYQLVKIPKLSGPVQFVTAN